MQNGRRKDEPCPSCGFSTCEGDCFDEPKPRQRTSSGAGAGAGEVALDVAGAATNVAGTYMEIDGMMSGNVAEAGFGAVLAGDGVVAPMVTASVVDAVSGPDSGPGLLEGVGDALSGVGEFIGEFIGDVIGGLFD